MRLKPLAAALAVAVGLAILAPLPAYAAEPDSGKITPSLQDRFRTEPSADFWITFKTKADLAPAEKIGDWTARGQFVYDALTAAAKDSVASVSAALDRAGAKYTSYPIANAVLVRNGTEKLALDVASRAQVAEIQAAPQVALVDPVEEEKAAARSDETVTWGLEAIHAPEAWKMGATGAGITVSNIDSGVQFDHPALVRQYRGTKPDGSVDHNYNWMGTRGSCAGAPCDDDGHGTHTMGTMVGADGTNRVGVAPDARWIATNGCCDDDGAESLLRSGWWLLAPTDVQGNNPDPSKRPHVVNNSWGQRAEHDFADFFQAVDEAWTAAGMFSVWSSGNTTPYAACDSVSTPGAAQGAYSVGAYSPDGRLAAFSRKGEGENGRIKPEISAPGDGVLSSYPNNSYVEASGTSMAAPHVAGAVAALWSYDPTLIGQVDETRRLLGASATDVDDTECGGTAAFNNKYGEGRLDLVRLLELAPREGGTLTGVVTAGGKPVAAAEVTISGPFSRSIGTDADGRFTTNLPAGDYRLSTTAFGYLTATADVTIALGEDTSVTLPLTAAARHDISGRVVDDRKQPVPNAAVTVNGTPLKPVRTGADGTFTIPGIPEGTYSLAVEPNACFASRTVPLTVGASNEPAEIAVGLVVDEGGYRCAVSEGEYLRGTEPVPVTNGVWATVKLPFPVALYNGSHDTLGVGLRGVIAPDGSTGPGYGGAGIFPFYVESPVEFAPGGGIFTAATKVNGEDAFVVEYRNAKLWAYPIRSEYTDPVTFSATLTRSGTVIFGYGDGVGGDDPVTAGAHAVTGIQGWAGVDGIRFSDKSPVLRDGLIVTYDLPDFGYLDATVADRNDGLPVAGAKVSFSNADGLVETVTTNGTGVVHRQLPVGDYTMTVDAPNYTTASYPFSLKELYAKAAIDVRLTTGAAGLKADGLEALLGTDQNGVGTLTLTNTGSAPLSYDLGEVARHPELDGAGAGAHTAPGAIDLSAWKAGGSGMTPSNADGKAGTSSAAEAQAAAKVGKTSGGDVIARIPIPGTIAEKEPTGIGYDGDVWVHDYVKRTNTAYSVAGKRTAKVFDASWNPAFRAFDMALDTRTGDMCQMEDSPASFIHCFDRETGKKTRQIKGDWSTLQLTGLAYNPARDVFYVGGRVNGMIGTVAGTSHDNPGALLSYCTPPLREVMGLAYNQASDTIWYTDFTSNRPSRLIQVKPDDCSLVNAYWFPGQKAGQGGGLETDATGALWAADQIADDVVLVDVEDDLTTDLPWLSLSSTGGTLAPGESATVTVSISSKDAGPGVRGANILVRSDSGRQSKTYVPVTLTTTKYQVGVNAGGAKLTDRSGFTWSADQASGDRAWGYDGETTVSATKAAIAGTPDPALFQSQRSPVDKQLFYRFPNAPKGTYKIDLGFAEIEKGTARKRVFDVLVNGTLTEYAYEPAAAADWRTALVKHAGGPLTVELRGSKGLKPPSIAALRATLVPRAAKAEAVEPEQPDPGPVPVALAGRSYAMKVTDGLYRQGTTKTAWTGDEVCGVLMFDAGYLQPFYDSAWDGVCVTTNGSLIFDRAYASGRNVALPSRNPIDAIYPFWDDFVVDDQAGIHLGKTEVDGLAAQVVEWRNVAFYHDRTARVSFSVTLIADGRIQIGYGDGVGGENPLTRGSSATVGVESLNRNPAHQHSFEQPVLTAGLGLEYTLPAGGTIEGTVTDANDGKPIEGAVVTLRGAAGERVVLTDVKGRWKAQALVGDNTVKVEALNYVPATRPVTITGRDQAEVRDTALTTGIATVTAPDLDWLLDSGRTATADVTVTNSGSAPLEVQVSEQKRGHEPADLPWLALTGPAAAGGVTLAPGASATVTVTVDTSGVKPGVRAGELLVASNAGKGGAEYRKVRMATSAYTKGVDAGGSGYVDPAGFFWSPDQELGSRPWGHVGGEVRTTRADVAGTEDDALFRSQRTGETFSYVFKGAPAGTYRIGLGFAELANVKEGKRAFDVLAGGKVLLHDHDVQAKVGALTADPNEVTVEHPGGDLTIEFHKEKGEGDPILNALKIQEDPRL